MYSCVYNKQNEWKDCILNKNNEILKSTTGSLFGDLSTAPGLHKFTKSLISPAESYDWTKDWLKHTK